jgi:glycerate 2-kinase
VTDSPKTLREAALAIWRAGLDAVDSERLVRNCVGWTDRALTINGRTFPLSSVGRILVVGAGKAGAGMAAGLESALAGTPAFERTSGWVNVPADCVRPLSRIHLHAARPAGLNEPTEEGVAGSDEILRQVGSLSAEDVCIVLLSGGGSALSPAPVPGVRLEDLQAVTRVLMAAGATIDELNCVRKHLSRIQGGRLARAAGKARVAALIVSDVVGDPLDVIASGPTVADPTTAADALAVLRKFARDRRQVPESVWSFLESAINEPAAGPLAHPAANIVIGNNATALNAAAEEARRLGWTVLSLGSENRGVARDVGRELARFCHTLRDAGGPAAEPICVLSGGEPVVQLTSTNEPRAGGRNQELILAAVEALWDDGMRQMAILSAGTDGEDGPTDAAGAIADAALLARARERGLAPGPFLAINNSYAFFAQADGLLITGPTHTNVMDVRVALIEPRPTQS